MSKVTEIGWTDHTWSPWWGCTKVSPACDHCYAEALDRRTGGAHWGPYAPRKMLSENHWRQPKKWNAAVPEGETRFVFPSMCDPFDNHASVTEAQVHFWELIYATPRLTWLLLTKRPGRILDQCAALGGLPANAAIGATVVTQAEADRDIPKLLEAKAALGARVAFLSIEPMLEPVDLSRSILARLDWVICGGESGPHARPMAPDWARSLRDQCAAAGVPFFFKQWGGRTPKAGGKTIDGVEWCERPRS